MARNVIVQVVQNGSPALPAASQAEMETGTEAALRAVSPLRVAQAIAALAAAGTDISDLTTLELAENDMLRVQGGALEGRSPAEVRDDLDVPAIEGEGDPVTATAATATVTPPTGSNHSVLYTAVTPGASGNDITVAYDATASTAMIDRAQALVTVSATDITVTYGDRCAIVVTANYGSGVETVTLPFVSEAGGSYLYETGVYSLTVIPASPTSNNAEFALSKSSSLKFSGTAQFTNPSFFTSVVASNGGTGTPTATLSAALASQVIAAVNAHPTASTLVTASASGASTGAVSVVSPAVALTGGGGSVGVTGVYPGQLYRNTLTGEWWKFNGTEWEQDAAGGTGAPAIETKTTNFTAALGGRYITEGTVTITDPSGTVLGQSYEVWIGSGTATIGGVAYAPSRFSIRRRYTGSAWATPAPYLTDALNFASGARAGTRTQLGAGTAGDAIFTAETKAQANAALGQIKIKQVTETLTDENYSTPNHQTRASSTTYGNDNELFVTVSANTIYKLDFHFPCGWADNGIKGQFACPSLAYVLNTGHGIQVGVSNANPTYVSSAGSIISLSANATANGNIRTIAGSIIFATGSTPGTMYFQWAKNDTDGAASNATVYKGSIMVLKELGAYPA